MRKGFTLIELLAVIVILAIIAVIAVPIVLNIINDSKESAVLRSADFYLDGVEKSIATAMLKNIQIADGTYSIMHDGNVCLGTLSNNTCTGDILKVEMDGEMPTEGTIKIKDGEIKKIDITLSNKDIWIDPFTNKLAYKLAPGLYDENDKLLASWDELVEEYDFKSSIELGTYDYPGEAASVINENFSNAYKLVLDGNVSEIFSGAFSGCENLKIILMGEGIKSINDWAFSLCESLEKVFIPSSVTWIGDSVFSSCPKLINIKVDSSNKIYDSRDNSNAIIETETNILISGCNDTIIPNSVTHIGVYAFAGSGLTEITIPNSVTWINDGAFESCTNLTEITIPSRVTHIGDVAFNACENLTEITIPNSVTSVGNDAFDNCPSLTTIYYKGTATGEPWGATNAKLETNF